MTSDRVTAGPIELRYTLTPDDLAGGFAAQWRGIRRRWLIAVLTMPPLIGLAIGFVRSESGDLPAGTAAIIAVAFLVVFLVAVGLSLLLYRLLLRWVYRWQARMLVRGTPWLSEPMRTTLTDTGVSARPASCAD